MACPDVGEFIGWKKGNAGDYEHGRIEVLIKLLIPEDALRSSSTGRKCRCNKAKVLDIEVIETEEKINAAFSIYDNNFYYKVGEIVTVDNFDICRFNEGGHGIHFFINKQEAIDYEF
jgi:hypothetical protein